MTINEIPKDENQQDLRGPEAVQKIKEIVKLADACFFCTSVSLSETEGARPMRVQHVDDYGNLWFLSARNSFKNRELAFNPNVKLYVQASAHVSFLELHGRATISTDAAKIRELWEPVAKNWFTGGMDDPLISVIQVTPTHGYYWNNKHGSTVAAVQMLISATTGKPVVEAVQGRIEVGRHR